LAFLIGILTPCALATDVPAGSDLFETPGPATGISATSEDFFYAPLPSGFFGAGSDPFSGKVYFKGSPLTVSAGSIIPATAPVDTIVKRTGAAVLPSDTSSTAVVPIEIVALSLVSIDPITVTFTAPPGTSMYSVSACLASPPTTQTPGTMTIHHTCAGGGTFESSLPVKARLTFTKVAGALGAAVVVMDPATLPVPLVVPLGYWSHSAPGLGIASSAAGGTVDHDCVAGTAAVAFPATTANFFFGVRSTCGNLDGAPPGCPPYNPPKKCVTHEESQLIEHGVLPAEDPVADPNDTDGDGIHDNADNCCNIFNPGQEDSNNNCRGDACEKSVLPVGGIPTVSQWGLIVMTLLLLTAATIIFARRRSVTTAT